jgi:NAD-dependent deacetylase
MRSWLQHERNSVRRRKQDSPRLEGFDLSETEQLGRMVAQAKHMVVFTGAGISAESGIPTYRGENGVWLKYDPEKYASISHFFREPGYYWKFFQEVRYPVLKKAEPNKAHRILARLEAAGILKAVITQNIDGLHQLAGSKRVLELHGNTRWISCLSCRAGYTMEEIYEQLATQLPPRCRACGGTLKPDVVFFGEALPPEVLDEAAAEAEKCDLFLVVGSSLVVQPAASLPVMARQRRAQLVIVNKQPTPLDGMADLVFHSSASEVLRAVPPPL